jgi:hypothetical protein
MQRVHVETVNLPRQMVLDINLCINSQVAVGERIRQLSHKNIIMIALFPLNSIRPQPCYQGIISSHLITYTSTSPHYQQKNNQESYENQTHLVSSAKDTCIFPIMVKTKKTLHPYA